MSSETDTSASNPVANLPVAPSIHADNHSQVFPSTVANGDPSSSSSSSSNSGQLSSLLGTNSRHANDDDRDAGEDDDEEEDDDDDEEEEDEPKPKKSKASRPSQSITDSVVEAAKIATAAIPQMPSSTSLISNVSIPESSAASSALTTSSSAPVDPLEGTNLPESLTSRKKRAPRPEFWVCFVCHTQKYRKSSGRSIRRHVLVCYRTHHPQETENMDDAALNQLIADKQDSGLDTGLRAWRFRKTRRPAAELPDKSRWTCPNGCGKYYRITSIASINNHKCQPAGSFPTTKKEKEEASSASPSAPASAPTATRMFPTSTGVSSFPPYMQQNQNAPYDPLLYPNANPYSMMSQSYPNMPNLPNMPSFNASSAPQLLGASLDGRDPRAAAAAAAAFASNMIPGRMPSQFTGEINNYHAAMNRDANSSSNPNPSANPNSWQVPFPASYPNPPYNNLSFPQNNQQMSSSSAHSHSQMQPSYPMYNPASMSMPNAAQQIEGIQQQAASYPYPSAYFPPGAYNQNHANQSGDAATAAANYNLAQRTASSTNATSSLAAGHANTHPTQSPKPHHSPQPQVSNSTTASSSSPLSSFYNPNAASSTVTSSSSADLPHSSSEKST